MERRFRSSTSVVRSTPRGRYLWGPREFVLLLCGNHSFIGVIVSINVFPSEVLYGE